MEPNRKPVAWLMARTHMDPLWRRGWNRETRFEGDRIPSYRQIQTDQVAAWLDLSETTRIPQPVEQALTLKAFLEDHPDERERLSRHAREGLVEPLGGGLTVTDTHLVDGETLVRNHFYARRWLTDLFGSAPRGASIPDAFGLSAQLPQIFHGLGYGEVDEYSRVFEEGETHWRGLDGTTLPLTKPGRHPGWAHVTVGPAGRYPACPDCRGNGCESCGHRGLDESESDRRGSAWAWNRFTEGVEAAKKSGAGNVWVTFWAEEIMEIESNVRAVTEHLVAQEYDVRTLGWGGLRDIHFKDRREQAGVGRIPEAARVAGPESGPVGTGAYLVRTHFKRTLQVLEDRLLMAEKWAALSGLAPYPRKEIEQLWWQVSLLGFHDSITGTHTDAAGVELEETARSATRAASRICEKALALLETKTPIPSRPGFDVFAVSNPWNWTVDGEVLTHTVALPVGVPEPAAVTLMDQDGKSITVLELKTTDLRYGRRVRITFVCPPLKPLALTPVYFKWEGPAAPVEPMGGATLENPWYRITLGRGHIAEVFDKDLGAAIGGPTFGSLEVSHDLGSPWETLAEPVLHRSLSDEPGNAIRLERFPGGQRAILSGTYQNRNPLKVRTCRWTQTVTLLDHEKRIRFRTELEWEGENARLSARFPLTFRTEGDRAIYEIPYGSLERKAYRPTYGFHLCANGDHPGQRVLACEDRARDLTVALLTKGLPTQRVVQGEIKLGLLRSPGEPLHVFDIEGAKETGHHVFEYAITSVRGRFEDSRLLHQGRAYAGHFPTIPATAHAAGGTFPKVPVPEGPLILTVVKKAEDGEDILLRGYDGYGKGSSWSPSTEGVLEPLTLAEGASPGANGFPLKPFEIGTRRWRSR